MGNHGSVSKLALGAETSALHDTLAMSCADQAMCFCIGAGVSKPQPSDLPMASELARDLKHRLADHMPNGPDSCADDDLLCVADELESVGGGRDLMQVALREVAPFDTALSNFAHEVLATLLIEGAISVISTNWDTCVERAPFAGGRIQSIVTDADRETLRGVAIHKVHGCIRRENSLLVSTAQLEDPNLWATAEVEHALSGSKIVFLGLGSVATYVSVRISQMLDRQSNLPQRIWLVARSISDQWDELVPDLSDDHKVAADASAFLEELLRAWGRLALRKTHEILQELKADGSISDEESLEASSFLDNLVGSLSAPSLIALLWEWAIEWPSGESPLHSQSGKELLVALGLMSSAESIELDDKRLRWKGRTILPVTSKGLVSSRILSKASSKIQDLRSRGLLKIDDRVLLVSAGHFGPLFVPDNLPDSIIDESDPPDLVNGSYAFKLDAVSAVSIIETGVNGVLS